MRVAIKEQEPVKSFVQTLPLADCTKLEEIAKSHGASRAEVVRAIIAEALSKPGFSITLHSKRKTL